MSGDDLKPAAKPSNGVRLTLSLNIATFLVLLAPLITTWSDVRQLKTEWGDRVTAERIAKIEANVGMLVGNIEAFGVARREVAKTFKENLDKLQEQVETIRNEQARRSSRIENLEFEMRRLRHLDR